MGVIIPANKVQFDEDQANAKYIGSSKEPDLAILNDMKAKGISTPEQAAQYVQQNWPDRTTQEPPLPAKGGVIPANEVKFDDPVEIAKKEAAGGAISKPLPGFWSTEGPVMGGALAGGILGAKVGAATPVPGGAFYGGLLGTIGGGAAGGIGSQILTDRPIDIKEAGREGAWQGAGYLTGEGGMFALKKLWPHVGKEFLQADVSALGEKLAPLVDKYLPKSQKVSQAFLPYQQASPYSAAGKWQNIIESSFGGRKPMASFRFATEKGVKDFADETAGMFYQNVQKIPNEQLGKVAFNAYDLAESAKDTVAKQLYHRVDTQAQGTVVDLVPLKDWLLNVKKGFQTGRSQTADALIDKMVSDIDDMKGVAGFVKTHEFRAGLNAEIRALESKDPAFRIANQAKSQLDGLMDRAAENSVNPDLKMFYHDATRFYRAFSKRYHNDFMQEFAEKAKDNPSLAVKMFIKPDQPELVKYLYKATGGKNSQLAQNIQAAQIEDWITQSSSSVGSEVATGEGGLLMGGRLENILKRMKPSELKAIFPDEVITRLHEVAKASATAQKKPSGAGGSMLVQLIQAGQLGTVAGGLGVGGYMGMKEGGSLLEPESVIPTGIATAALFTPRIVAKLMVHPVYGKWFVEGMKPTRGLAYQSWQQVNKLIAAAVSYAQEDNLKQKQNKALESLPGQQIQSRQQGGSQ